MCLINDVDFEEDSDAKDLAKYRIKHKYGEKYSCYAMVKAKGKTYFGFSQKGASCRLHAEREAIKEMFKKLSAKGYDQNHGDKTAKALNKYKISIGSIYIELPPCAECKQWLKKLCNGLKKKPPIFYFSEFVDYYTEGENQKRMWVDYFKNLKNI